MIPLLIILILLVILGVRAWSLYRDSRVLPITEEESQILDPDVYFVDEEKSKILDPDVYFVDEEEPRVSDPDIYFVDEEEPKVSDPDVYFVDKKEPEVSDPDIRFFADEPNREIVQVETLNSRTTQNGVMIEYRWIATLGLEKSFFLLGEVWDFSIPGQEKMVASSKGKDAGEIFVPVKLNCDNYYVRVVVFFGPSQKREICGGFLPLNEKRYP